MATKMINELLLENEKERNQQIYLKQPIKGEWHEFSWGKVMHQARQVAQFLQKQGLKKGDRVTVCSKNCAEWFITDFGISLAGMVSVPLFSNQHVDSMHYILKHSDVKLVFVGKLDQPKAIRAQLPEDMPTVSFDYHSELDTNHTWSDVLAVEPLAEVVMPDKEDLYTIIYTSGTSGDPKGAVYTHETIGNYLTIFPKDILRFTREEHHHFISYLPLAHVYERTAVELASLTISCDVSFVESLEKFAENLQEVQPTIFTAVPRIWGVFKQKIETKLPPHKMNLLLKIPLVSTLIKKKIRRQLGLTRANNCASGASHLPLAIIDFFEKLGILIQEGYGQTENLAYATLNLRDRRKKGYVGTTRLGVDMKIGPEEEVLLKSDCMTTGYYLNEEATKELFADGWLRTGDVGEIDEAGNLKILCRLSEIFKNQKGEFISPSPIEKSFSCNRHIENLCLVGSSLPKNVMLVSLTPEAMRKDKEKLEKELIGTLKKVNEGLLGYEKIGHVIVTADAWIPENGLLTPTLKVRRRQVAEFFQEDIDKSFEHPQSIYWTEKK